MNSIPIISYVFFSLFVAVSLLQVTLAFLEQEKLRKIVKPFCLFFLFLATVFATPTHSLLYLGVLLGMVGDIFLISIKPRFFIPGMISFFIGHLLYLSEILFILGVSQYLPWWFYLVSGLFLLASVLAFYKLSFNIAKHKVIAVLGNLYLALLVLVSIVFLVAQINIPGRFYYLGIIGGVSFLLSDLILTQATFIKDFKRRDFYIMTFYLIGQVLIVLGIALNIPL